jgi:hypothetical protein
MEVLIQTIRFLFVTYKPGISRNISSLNIFMAEINNLFSLSSSSEEDWKAHKVKARQVREFASSTSFSNRVTQGE